MNCEEYGIAALSNLISCSHSMVAIPISYSVFFQVSKPAALIVNMLEEKVLI